MKIRWFLMAAVFAAFTFTGCKWLLHGTDEGTAPPAKEEAKEEEKK